MAITELIKSHGVSTSAERANNSTNEETTNVVVESWEFRDMATYVGLPGLITAWFNIMRIHRAHFRAGPKDSVIPSNKPASPSNITPSFTPPMEVSPGNESVANGGNLIEFIWGGEVDVAMICVYWAGGRELHRRWVDILWQVARLSLCCPAMVRFVFDDNREVTCGIRHFSAEIAPNCTSSG